MTFGMWFIYFESVWLFTAQHLQVLRAPGDVAELGVVVVVEVR